MTSQITLQFSTSTHWQSKIIRDLCHSPFSHVDCVLEDGNLLGASDSPDAPVVSGNPWGVAIRVPNYQEFGIRRQMIIQTDKAPLVLGHLHSQVGRPFDNAALHQMLGFKREEWRDPGQWFCSELIVWAFEKAGYWSHDLIWPKSRISPTDLLLIFSVDPNFVNWAAFWDKLDGLIMGLHEQ